MKKSGLADSPLFYTPPPRQKEVSTSPAKNSHAPKKTKIKTATGLPSNHAKPVKTSTTAPSPKKIKTRNKTPRHRDAMPPSNHDTMVSRHHDAMVELVRKAVKEFGKEAATHRFTVEEKKGIADIIYSYTRQGIKTSENQITRVAVNFIIEDYKENGENSILDGVLKALRA